jgi:glutamate-1-semialdehyde 2,1-aminomutase
VNDPRAALPHGVTGAGRAATPVFVRARGPWLWDRDEHRYLDLHGGYGTAILGYSDRRVDGAVAAAMAAGCTFVGTANRYEGALAARLAELLPEAERVALCGGGGTDGLYHAVRLARAATGRELVAKVDGGYQGWHGVLGASTVPAPGRPGRDEPPSPPAVANSRGILPAVTAALRIVGVNDEASLRLCFERDGDALAALVVEPILYSAGTVEVDPSWLALARELCDRHGALLIFDEVVSGFRERVGGAGPALGVLPDMAVYGKAIANGHVLAALAGRADVLDLLAPGGPVFFSGTFNAAPLGCIAASATLDVLERGEAIPRAVAAAAQIAERVNAAIARLGIRAVCQQRGSAFTLYLGTDAVRDARDLAAISGPAVLALNDALRAHLLADRIFLQYRRGTNRAYVSAAHEDEHVDVAAASLTAFLQRAAGDPVLA